MRMIEIKGYKKTGKTTTCERVIEELIRRGYTVGSVKSTHSPDFAMDTPGTDSDRHAKAGASTVTVVGREGSEVLFYRPVPLSELIGLYHEDFLVCEGDSGMDAVNIITGRTEDDLEKRRDARTIGFSGIVAAGMTEYEGLPVIDATRDITGLVDLIEERSTEL